MSNSRISAAEVYKVLKPFNLTTEQRSAVENAPTDSASLVVAGAGSGKTELMSVRVLWLVANRICKPEQILGLTFTRKAANELNRRIYDGLIKLRDSELWPENLEYDFTPPTISTYNSYANRVFREWALPLGYDDNVRLISEAASFQLAREVVFQDGPTIDARLYDLDSSANQLVEAVLSLNQQMQEHSVHSAEVELEISELLGSIDALPQKANSDNFNRFEYLNKLLAPLGTTPVVAKLAAAFQQRKQELGLVDYADQVALAARAIKEFPGAVLAERSQFSQVLLDEYQDTSVLQTRFLAQLYQGCAVYAVGDPNQSIYGWRGASAANLANFSRDFNFGVENKFSLSTSWRNPADVLSFANHLLADLRVLELQPAPGAVAGRVEISVSQTLDEELVAVANWFSQRLTEETTAALLLRKKANMRAYVAALEKAGLAVEVIGLGGLLSYPEIVDLTSALKVITKPDAGSELLRLLAGPRWRLGPSDLQILAKFANRLSKIQQEEAEEQGVSPEAIQSVSIIEALDEIPESRLVNRFNFSAVGLARLKDAALTLRAMRKRNGVELVDFVTLVAEELWLDIEVIANPQRSHPLSQLHAFYEVVRNFSDSSARSSLLDFVDWLDFAAERERFEVPEKNAQQGVVQVLTAHAAKGLEWDYVAVASLVEGDFPDSPDSAAKGWFKTGVLPFSLRGDGSGLPKLSLGQVSSQPEARDAIENFFTENRTHHQQEELRLAYVAFTRPKKELMLAASYWKPANKKPRELSKYLKLAADFFKLELPARSADENPLENQPQQLVWPLDPLGHSHRERLSRAEQITRNLLAQDLQSTSDRDETADLLLAERESRLEKTKLVSMPIRIQASRFSDYIFDLDRLAELARRPLPQKPFKASQTGTLFHSWLEQKFTTQIEFDDQRFSELGDDFDLLIENFENSDWAKRKPFLVEKEIQISTKQNTFVCKLDAVFKTAVGYQIVDWKTGRQPATELEKAKKDWQLALYRWAFSKAYSIDIEDVTASLFFVTDGVTYTPENLPDESEILQAWNGVLEQLVF